jgi:UDP-N-acetylglucosamine transferase subunit ALG13
MMCSLSALPAQELHVQHGPASPPDCASAYRFLPFSRMVELIERADVVVTHAGVGSIMCALRAGHVPIVFPRLKRYDETVDDHQAELAEAMARRGSVTVAWTPEELCEAIAAVAPRAGAQMLDGGALSSAVRRAIHGEAPSSLWRPASVSQ